MQVDVHENKDYVNQPGCTFLALYDEEPNIEAYIRSFETTTKTNINQELSVCPWQVVA